MSTSFSLDFIFPIITVTLSFLFFLSVTEQYLRKHKTHQLVWAIAMFLFLVTAGAEGLSLFLGFWDPFIYRIYYILAAIQVALMGAGALYLFASREIINVENTGKMLVLFGIIWTMFAFLFQLRSPIFQWIFLPAVLITASGFLYWGQIRFRDPEKSFKISGTNFAHFFVIFTIYIFIFMTMTALNAPLDFDTLIHGGGKEIAGHGWISDLPGARATVRLFSPLNTVPGGVALIGGAFYSYIAWQFSIKKRIGSFNPKMGVFNIWIGGGALVLGLGGTLSGFGITFSNLFGLNSLETIFGSGFLYVSEAISVTFMYFGFLESDKITWQKLRSAITLGWLRHREEPSSIVAPESGL